MSQGSVGHTSSRGWGLANAASTPQPRRRDNTGTRGQHHHRRAVLPSIRFPVAARRSRARARFRAVRVVATSTSPRGEPMTTSGSPGICSRAMAIIGRGHPDPRPDRLADRRALPVGDLVMRARLFSTCVTFKRLYYKGFPRTRSRFACPALQGLQQVTLPICSPSATLWIRGTMHPSGYPPR